MARTSLLVGAVFALLATAPFLAAAEAQGTDVLGKGFIAPTIMHSISTGKGAVPADVNVDVQCTDVCSDVCTPVPQKVCNEVPYQTQVCNKVAVPKTKQVCNRVCTKTTVTTEHMATPPTVTSTSTGKGGESMVMVSTGKGHRRLAGADSTDMLPLPLLAGKALFAKAAGAMIGAKVVAGGAMIAHHIPQTQADVQCNDVCNDVQFTVYEDQCGMVTNTRTKCDIIFSQSCQKVCKPSCKKITTTTTTTTMPISTGKGTHVMMSMGKGH